LFCRYNTTPFYAPVLLSRFPHFFLFFCICEKPKIYILGWVFIYTIFISRRRKNKTISFYWIRKSTHYGSFVIYYLRSTLFDVRVFVLRVVYVQTRGQTHFLTQREEKKGRHFFSRVITKLWLACVRLFETYILSHTLNYYITFLSLSLFYTHTQS
jgi:hypothetical protein